MQSPSDNFPSSRRQGAATAPGKETGAKLKSSFASVEPVTKASSVSVTKSNANDNDIRRHRGGRFDSAGSHKVSWTKPLRGSAAWQRRSHPIVLHF
jgi:hypothetical protein